jgi:hypothetical protein
MQQVISTHKQITHHNALCLSLIPGACIDIPAEDRLTASNVSPTTAASILAKARKKDPRDTLGLFPLLRLKLNMLFDMTCNSDIGDGLSNGAWGISKLVEFTTDCRGSSKATTLWIHFVENSKIGCKLCKNSAPLFSSIQDIEATWTPVHRISKQFTVDKRRAVSKVSRTQFPIRNAIGSTYQRSQGLTVKKGALDFSRYPLAGKHYVGLSRFTNEDSFFILNLAENEIKVSEEVKQEMVRLRSQRALQLAVLPLVNCSPHKFTVSQHNVRSLHAHHADIKADANFLNSDITFISETWARSVDSDSACALE